MSLAATGGGCLAANAFAPAWTRDATARHDLPSKSSEQSESEGFNNEARRFL
jgi:hypothetical protein